ncbi:MAG: hypothetical protein ACM3SM_15120 [Bacteroidota bacterium]
MKNIATVFALLILICSPLYSQAEYDTLDTVGGNNAAGETYNENTDQDGHHSSSLEGWLSKLGIRLKKNQQERYNSSLFRDRPSIEFGYFYSSFLSDNIVPSFPKIGALQVGLGYESLRSSHFSEHVRNIQSHYFKFTIMDDNISHKKNVQKDRDKYKMWQVSWNQNNGHGIEFSEDFYLIPYYSFGFTGTHLKYGDNSYTGTHADSAFIKRFNDKFRIGSMVESGIRLKLFQTVSLKTGYTRHIILPGILFWKQSASYCIDVSIMAILDDFVDDLAQNSPYLGTIFKYAIQGGVLYGMTQLRHEKMAWPFNSDAPLYNDSFNFSVSFMF